MPEGRSASAESIVHSMGSRPDKRFGRYEVVSEIGRGSMGAVYKARDPKIDRFVAIKSISAISQSPEEEQEYRERFFHEAQAAGRLVHPGIVTIYDVGEESEARTPYIVMEFVGGQSLSGLLSSEIAKLPLEIALRLTEEIADALDCAHSQGVVHRDIKPANILLSGDGHAKIADFGIAKLNLTNVTLPGHALGTPAYMSPEQVDGRSVDGRSDLFSLGVILYNMVTGHRPFQGTSAVTVCYKVANWNPLPPTSLDMALPTEVDAVITRALAKEPADRYQRGMEFAREVRELRHRLSRAHETATVSVPSAVVPSRVPSKPRPQTADAKPTRHKSRDGQQDSPLLAPGNFFLGFAALVLAIGLAVVLFGVPFKKRTPILKSVLASSLPSTKPSTQSPSAAPVSVPAPVVADVTPAAQPAPVRSARGPKPFAKPHPRSAEVKEVALPPSLPAPVVQPATLKIEVQHHFADGKLSLWVDEKLAYSTDLHGEAKRHLAVFHGVDGSKFAEVSVPPGPHTLRVNGQSNSLDFDESKTITASFTTGDEKILHVNFEKNNREMRLALQ